MFTIDYSPKNLNDVVFARYESKCRIYDIVTGAEPLPYMGKTAILLYGTFGTGKTTLAKMLPEAIEQKRYKDILRSDSEFIACKQGFNGPQIMDLISKVLDKISFNTSGIHYFILDEVDNLTKAAQQSLKSALNATRGLFILTTNNVSQLDKGLLDRCVLIEMNAAEDNQLLPFAQNIAKELNAEVSDEELLPVIQAANGSFRNISHNIERHIRRKNMPSNIIF